MSSSKIHEWIYLDQDWRYLTSHRSVMWFISGSHEIQCHVLNNWIVGWQMANFAFSEVNNPSLNFNVHFYPIQSFQPRMLAICYYSIILWVFFAFCFVVLFSFYDISSISFFSKIENNFKEKSKYLGRCHFHKRKESDRMHIFQKSIAQQTGLTDFSQWRHGTVFHLSNPKHWRCSYLMLPNHLMISYKIILTLSKQLLHCCDQINVKALKLFRSLNTQLQWCYLFIDTCRY